MQITLTLKNVVLAGMALVALGAGASAAANRYGKPKSVLHVVVLHYKDGVTEEQKKSVLEATEKMAAEMPGIKNLWLKPARVQGAYADRLTEGGYKLYPFTDSFALEFESEAAWKAYDDHAAHRAWEKVYLPLRGHSNSHAITNQ